MPQISTSPFRFVKLQLKCFSSNHLKSILSFVFPSIHLNLVHFLTLKEWNIVTMMSIATTIPIILVQILTLVESDAREQSIFDIIFINHHLFLLSSTILDVQILTLVEKDAKERMLKFQASSPDSYFYVYRCTPYTYHLKN